MTSPMQSAKLYDLATTGSRRLGGGGEPPDNNQMEYRIAQLEDFALKTGERLAAIDVRLAKIETKMDQFATKADLAGVQGSLAGMEGSLKADLHKAISEQTWKLITWTTGIATALIAATFFIARNIH